MSFHKHVRYFYGKPGHEFAVLKNGEITALSGADWSADALLLEGCEALLSKAPKTQWAGMAESVCGDHTMYGGQAPTPAGALELLSVRIAEDKAEAERRNDPVYLLEALLKRHDWYAHYSDDSGVVRASDRHWERIQQVRAQVPKDVGDALVAQYQPKAAEGV